MKTRMHFRPKMADEFVIECMHVEKCHNHNMQTFAEKQLEDRSATLTMQDREIVSMNSNPST